MPAFLRDQMSPCACNSVLKKSWSSRVRLLIWKVCETRDDAFFKYFHYFFAE